MSNKSAMIEFESGATPVAMSALTNSGDNKTFTSSADLFSELDGYAPDVRPNGVVTGGDVTVAASAANNAVDVELASVYLAGELVTVTADLDVTITRPTTNVAKVNSITVNSSGVVAVVAGTDGSTTAFSETRGAAGGPPYIPVGSIELAQVRVTTSAAATITEGQIFKKPNVHRERAFYPAMKTDNVTGRVIFSSALVASHTGDVTKAVYASYAEPIFSEQEFGNDFVPAETSHSVTSTNTYSGPVGSSSATLNQASFTAILNDGITDEILSVKNQKAWVRFYQNKMKTAHILTQGLIGISRTFNVDNRPQVSVTVSAELPSVERTY